MSFNNAESKNTFVPKQALAPTPTLYDELTADGMINLAKVTLAQIPRITNGSIIHDNGCGTGAGTSAIVAAISDPSTKISIKGTDISSQALEIYSQKAAKDKWPAEAVKMDSCALSFPDETFTHSLNSALLFVLPDDGIAAPGGIALFNSWAYVPNMSPIQAAATATRPPGTPLPRQGLEKWTQASHLQSVIENGGFEKEKTMMATGDIFVTTCEIERYAAMLWSFIGGTSSVGWLESDEQN
ncbi:hypothetical protein EG329_006425 [Mollisiaceae sp. DMI_Dod_QoI]|nr:hypothetical protein EG329_006425 [Helotiales sp. DMI_Dod_QoI]